MYILIEQVSKYVPNKKKIEIFSRVNCKKQTAFLKIQYLCTMCTYYRGVINGKTNKYESYLTQMFRIVNPIKTREGRLRPSLKPDVLTFFKTGFRKKLLRIRFIGLKCSFQNY